MIEELKNIIDSNKTMTFDSYMKGQMVLLYKQLSICEDIPNSEFLKIIQRNPIFVDVDEKYKIRGTITVLLEQKMLRGGRFVAHIEDLVVDEHYRNLGTGKQLVEHAVNFAKSMNCYKIILNCSTNMLPFYEKCGFVSKNVEMSMYL